jgi:hypothetical protein
VVESINYDFTIGTQQNLEQAGFNHEWWPLAAGHHYTARNACRVTHTGQTAQFNKFGEEFTGLIIPFGAAVKYKQPKPLKDDLNKFDNPQRWCLFAGWDLRPGGLFKGDYRVIDLDDFNTDGDKVHVKVVKNLIMPTVEELRQRPWRFPMAEARFEQRLRIQQGHQQLADAGPPELVIDDIVPEEVLQEIVQDPASMDPPPLADPVPQEVVAPDPSAPTGYRPTGEPIHPEEAQAELDGIYIKPTSNSKRPPWIYPYVWSHFMWPKDRKAEGDRYRAWLVQHPPRAPEEPAAVTMQVPLARECALNATSGAKRIVVEMCCSPDSVLGQPSVAAEGTEVIRLTLDCDLRTQEGEQYAEAVCRSNPGCRLWGSIPCVQGSPFYNLNKKHEHARDSTNSRWPTTGACGRCT